MTMDRRLLAGVLGLTLVLAACGAASTSTKAPAGGGTATDAPTTEPVATAEATEDAAATEEPEPTEEATDASGAEPSLVPGAAGDLEAMLPDEAGGIKFQKTSFDGASLGTAGFGIDTGELGPILKANGKSVNDVRLAIAAPADTSGSETAMVVALQIDGVPGDKLLGLAGTDASGLTKSTIGGKEVLSAGAGGLSVMIYAKDDVLFEILLASPAVAEDILRQLP